MAVKMPKITTEDLNVQKDILKNSVMKEVNLKSKPTKTTATPKDEQKEAVFEIKGDKTML